MQLEQSLQEASYPLRHDIDLHLTVMAVRRLPFIANLSEVDRAMLSTVVSELGSNILKYAERGEITLTLHHPSGRPCIDIVARDQGPGIGDVHQAMQDHYSTSGTLGLGLPGVRRMMSELTISTPPEGGTLVQARKWLGAVPLVSRPIPPLACTGQLHAGLQLTWASENRPCYPERVSGDLAFIRPGPEGVSLILIDVSGHGASANKLVQVLEAALQQTHEQEPARLLQLLHQHCIGTRGAAAGVALVNGERGELSYAGIGNTRICLRGHEPWRGISRDGVLGERFPTPLLQRQQLVAGDVVMLYSDGISESLNLRDGALDLAAEPAQLARQVIAHSGRSTDDASCIVLRVLAGKEG
ncbi:ATP-binding SpoIIE family protein phosphatase [Aeromonas caviae]|uniref:ATP-binding SpoIIE family protein phosphatase n=1 Tax=Aeromonas caviae TaxID=648 RepID=UPI0029D5075A|nr:ATP-binding SpoIIE family protein phosphatase [Aeromonas caviae]MDX7781759.1 ATP-binding SpoIIE family protein phosphatase [Aeromonas caviae]MDY7765178.1 ATP-binding SpoIIE family protein phosphatase [Aeromonas caviae]